MRERDVEVIEMSGVYSMHFCVFVCVILTDSTLII